MAGPHRMAWCAVTAEREILSAVRLWESKFADGAERLRGHGGEIYYLPEFGVWGGFRRPTPPHPNRYWNPFGKSSTGKLAGMSVEINPPTHGFNPNIQGVIAQAPDGARWALHQGFLHTPTKNITEEMFDKTTKMTRVDVVSPHGGVVSYYPVVNIDAPTPTVKLQLASFVQECSRIRESVLDVIGAQKASDEERKVQEAENSLTPEPTGFYLIRAQETKRAERLHGLVWKELRSVLQRRGVPLSNQRLGRFGPDLRTWGKNKLLFEIKSNSDAHSLQQAIGQLMLYERLLPGPHRKVLVRPSPLPSQLVKPLQELGIEVLVFTKRGRGIAFNYRAINALLAD